MVRKYRNVTVHLNYITSVTKFKAEGEIRYKCCICTAVFREINHMMVHIDKHTDRELCNSIINIKNIPVLVVDENE